MHLIRIFLIYVLCLVLLPGVSAQQFGGNPASTKWQQVNTDSVRVIFPVGLQRKGREISSLAREITPITGYTIGDRFKKINIVLQPQTIIPNGYVGMGPYRSEFQLTPVPNSFELGSLPWHSTLALHEYRHVQQYNNFRVGLSGLVYTVLGQEAGALVNGAAIPNWFWEGDAVFQETLLSQQGRGRLPFFFNDYRSLWASKKDYSWMKLRNGSLRDFVPDHYRLGFMMVAYGREKYGDTIWKPVTHDAASYKGLFYPFQRAVKKYTGKSYAEFRSDAIQYFQNAIPVSNDDTVAEIGEAKHFLGDEEFPQWIDNDHLVFVLSSYKKNPRFVVKTISTGVEMKIRAKDISPDNYFSYNNGKIVYASYNPDPRWSWRDYSVLNLVDVKSGKQKQLTVRSKYFLPDIDNEGKRIVAINVSEEGNYQLHILDASSGKRLTEIANTDNIFPSFPKFYGDDRIVTAVRNASGEMALALIPIDTGIPEYLTPFSMNVIGYISVSKDSIYFSASSGDKDRLFLLAGKKLYQFNSNNQSSLTGAYAGDLSNGRYAWTVFTAAGMRVISDHEQKIDWVPVEETALQHEPQPYKLPGLEGKQINLLAETKPSNDNVQHYSKSFHLFNFHSLRPYISDPDYSVAWVSENILNTLQSEFSFLYNTNEQYKQIGFTGIFSGWYPWIQAGVDYTVDRRARTNSGIVYWNELQPRVGLSIPLNLTSGKYYRNLDIGSNLVYNKSYFQGNYKDSFDARGFSYLSSAITFTNQIQTARQHIYPRFAQTLQLTYRNAITRFDNWQFLTNAGLYFPGAFVTHNLVLQGAFQVRDTGVAFFSNSFPFSRGYTSDNFNRMYKVGVNYHIPLLYPDAGFANIVYFLRIRANIFYDYTKTFVEPSNQPGSIYRSLGTEIFFDTKWWNQQPVSFGFRYSHLIDPDNGGRSPNQWEFILPVNLIK